MNARPDRLPSQPSVPKKVAPTFGETQSKKLLQPAVVPDGVLSTRILEPKKVKKTSEKEKQKHETSALQVLFNFETISPLVIQAMKQTEEAEQIDTLKRLLHHYEKSAQEWSKALSEIPEDQQWIEPQVFRLLAQMGATPQPTHFLPLIESLPYTAPVSFDPPSAKLAYQVFLAQATMPLMRAQILADGYRNNPEQDMIDLARLIGEQCQFILEEWAPGGLHTEGRQLLFQHLMSEAGKLMAQIWLKYAHHLKQTMEKKSASAQQLWKQENPQGMDIGLIQKDFKILFSRLHKLSKMIE